MYAVLNIETGEYYSESTALKREMQRVGQKWENGCILPSFARRYTSHKAALRRSQKCSDLTGCFCAVVRLS